MTPEEISATYEVLAPMSTDYVNANLERAGQAQASYGPLAQAAMGGSQTAGIGNYTYNRLVRPAVDTMRDQLVVEGYSSALNKQLSDTLNKAKENYNRASRRYSLRGSSGTGGNTGSNKNNKFTIDDELLDQNGKVEGSGLYLSGSEAFNMMDKSKLYSKGEIEAASGKSMSDTAYEIYKALYMGDEKKAEELSKQMIRNAEKNAEGAK